MVCEDGTRSSYRRWLRVELICFIGRCLFGLFVAFVLFEANINKLDLYIAWSLAIVSYFFARTNLLEHFSQSYDPFFFVGVHFWRYRTWILINTKGIFKMKVPYWWAWLDSENWNLTKKDLLLNVNCIEVVLIDQKGNNLVNYYWNIRMGGVWFLEERILIGGICLIGRIWILNEQICFSYFLFVE